VDAPKPEPAPTLEQQKQKLAASVQAEQRAAAERIAPALKRPLIEMRTKMAAATPWADRTMSHREALNNQKGLNARLVAVDLHAAEQLAAIADLTDETIGEFKMAPFPEPSAPVEASLEQQKEQLAGEVDVELQARQRAVLPPLKRPLLDLQLRQAMTVEADKRSAPQKQVIADREALDARLQALELHAAKLKASIAELTGDSVASWMPEPFPEV
jgi:hypothetical protein